MPIYKLQKKSEKGRRVVVRPDYVEIHVPALIVCVLLALGIWLYVVNFTEDVTIAGGDTSPTPPAVTEPIGPSESDLPVVE